MKKLAVLTGILMFWSLLFLYSCKNDDFEFDAPNQELRFSADTVFCDTVYHQVRSETYAVKVYNTEDKDVLIPRIVLEKGQSSLYRINVDGKSGYQFQDVPLRKKDSLYIFVEIAPTANGPEAIAEDRILFSGGAGQQHVTLFSVVQDADFFVQKNSGPVQLTGNTVWSNTKAKIIYGNLEIPSGSSLSLQPGTKVYFHKNSGLKVKSGASITATGDYGSEVTFRGDRNDPYYDFLPKTWNAITLEKNTVANFNYVKIFGATNGIDASEATLNLKNTIIHSCQEYGVRAVNSNLTAQNLVTNNCGIATLGILGGGTAVLTHVTLANYWQYNSVGAAAAMVVSNKFASNGGATVQNAVNLNVANSILYSKNANAVILESQSGVNFNYLFRNSLLKFGDNAGFNFDGNPLLQSCWKNEDPQFEYTAADKMNLRVKANSFAKAKGNLSIAATVPLDLPKISRTASPTLGAYQ